MKVQQPPPRKVSNLSDSTGFGSIPGPNLFNLGEAGSEEQISLDLRLIEFYTLGVTDIRVDFRWIKECLFEVNLEYRDHDDDIPRRNRLQRQDRDEGAGGAETGT